MLWILRHGFTRRTYPHVALYTCIVIYEWIFYREKKNIVLQCHHKFLRTYVIIKIKVNYMTPLRFQNHTWYPYPFYSYNKSPNFIHCITLGPHNFNVDRSSNLHALFNEFLLSKNTLIYLRPLNFATTNVRKKEMHDWT